MHIRTISQVKAAPAFNVEIVLDIVLQFITVLRSLEQLLGIDISDKIGTTS